MDCDFKLIEKFFNNELPARQEDEVFNHVIACDRCGDYLATLSLINQNKFELKLAYQQTLQEKEGESVIDYLKSAFSHKKLIFAGVLTTILLLITLGRVININDSNSSFAYQIEKALDFETLVPAVRDQQTAEVKQAITAIDQQNYQKALNILKKTNEPQGLILLLKGVASFYNWKINKSNADLQQSIQFLNQALTTKNKNYKEYALLILAEIYLLQDNSEYAKKVLKKGKLLEQDHYPLINEILNKIE